MDMEIPTPLKTHYNNKSLLEARIKLSQCWVLNSVGHQIQIIRIYLGIYLPRKDRYPSALALIIQVSVWSVRQIYLGIWIFWGP
jgi:hypothetical protein